MFKTQFLVPRNLHNEKYFVQYSFNQRNMSENLWTKTVYMEFQRSSLSSTQGTKEASFDLINDFEDPRHTAAKQEIPV